MEDLNLKCLKLIKNENIETKTQKKKRNLNKNLVYFVVDVRINWGLNENLDFRRCLV